MTVSVTPAPGMKERFAGLVLRTIGQASDCVRLGYARGFDSGEMMDAIYRDVASGRWGVGAIIDRIYLDQPGCRGLRGRKALLVQTIAGIVAEQRSAGLRPVVVDVAAGPATYLVELLATDLGSDLRVLARDRDPHGLERGRTIARAAVVDDRLHYEPGDALDEVSVLGIRPRPTIAIASGFYELLLDDAPIVRSMGLLRRLLEPGGRFVFTTQVAHPQVAMMAAVPAHDGRPWIIRNQPLEAAERLAHDAGFTTVVSRIEPTGIFAVSVAS